MTASQMLARERERKQQKHSARLRARLLRPKQIYGKNGIINVGRTTFNEQYILRDPNDPYIPATNIPRLRPARLGLRAIAFFDDEVFETVEALRQHRDADRIAGSVEDEDEDAG
jgi:hypothetical protein